MSAPVTRDEMAAFEAMVANRFGELETRLRQNIGDQVEQVSNVMKQTIGDVVEGASKGFADEQARINASLTESVSTFQAEHSRIEEMVKSVAEGLQSVDVRRLEEMKALIEESQSKFASLEQTQSSNMATLHGLHGDLWSRTSERMEQFRQEINGIQAESAQWSWRSTAALRCVRRRR